jgi:hypothetical protein
MLISKKSQLYLIITGRMKPALKFILAGMLVISIGTNLNARPAGLQSRWHDENTTPFNIGEYSHKKNILYLISNNDEYLFLNMVIPLPDEQKKILLFGLTVYVDLAGGTRKDLAIMYPFRRIGARYGQEKLSISDSLRHRQMMMPGEPSKMQPSGHRPLMDFEAVKYALAERTGIIVLKGYSDTADIVAIPSTDPREVHGMMAYDSNGVLHYSLAIPFAKVPIRQRLKKSGFGLGLETGFFNPEQNMAQRPRGPGAMGGRPGGGMGPPGGAMGYGGMRAGGPGERGVRQPMDPAQRQARMEQMQALGVATKFRIKKIRLAERE